MARPATAGPFFCALPALAACHERRRSPWRATPRNSP